MWLVLWRRTRWAHMKWWDLMNIKETMFEVEESSILLMSNWWTCIPVMQLYVYIYICGNIINNNDEQTHFFRKIYLSHFIRKSCVWEVSWRLNRLQNIDPPPSSSVFSSTSFLILPGCSIEGSGGPNPLLGACSRCLELLLELQLWLQLTQLSVAGGYIIVWCPPASCKGPICTEFNPSMVKVISWYLRSDAPVSRLTAGSKVNMLQTSISSFCKLSKLTSAQ